MPPSFVTLKKKHVRIAPYRVLCRGFKYKNVLKHEKKRGKKVEKERGRKEEEARRGRGEGGGSER